MKPHVYFIELQIANKTKHICDITERFYEMGKSIVVFASEKPELLQLDDRLWTWKQESFVPHAIFKPGIQNNEPVQLIHDPDNLPGADVIILHDPIAPDKLTAYKIIIDFAEVYHPEKRKNSRIRYKRCRDEGYPLDFIKLGAFLAKNDADFISV